MSTALNNPGIPVALGGYEPTGEQLAAIAYDRRPLAIIAGAGSGKTAVMAARIAHLIADRGVQPSAILGLTFTNKAAHELRERVRRAVEPLGLDPGDEPSVFTYNSFADRLIREFGPRIGIEPEVALLSEAQAHMLMTRLLEHLTFDRISLRAVSYRVGQMRRLADQCSNHLLEPEQIVAADRALRDKLEKVPKKLADTFDERPDYCKAVRAYIDRKRALGRIDYGDQITFAYRIVAEHPEVAAILRSRWTDVLLDEYQDTNVAQRMMMEAIYPQGSAITVVGDPDQAIYAWRGATLHNILRFPDHFRDEAGEPAATLPLETSFRSGRTILAAAAALIGKVDPARRGVADKKLNHHPSTGEGEVTCDLYASDDAEAEGIAQDILAARRRGTEYGEIAILCRKSRLFDKIQLSLRKHDIPVEVVGLGGLLTSPEIVDLLAYLRILVRPGDNISFARIAMGPRWRISYRDMAALARWAAAHTRRYREMLESKPDAAGEVDPGEERFSLSEALGSLDEIEDLSDEARSRLAALAAELGGMRTATRGRSLTEAIEIVVDTSGLDAELESAAGDLAELARNNISSFLDRATAFAPLEGSTTIEAFIDYLDAARAIEDIEAAQPQMDNAVKLMTIHQAKGLEFDVVFVPGLSEDIFPDLRVDENPAGSPATVPYWARQDQDHLPAFTGVLKRFHEELKLRAEEEERRLGYVALTRARKTLRLSAAWWYASEYYERKHPNGPGLFFRELAGNDETPGHPAVTVRRSDDCPDHNPMRDHLEQRARGWPPSDEAPPDPVFPGGWRRAAEDALAGEAPPSVAGLDPQGYERERALVADQLALLATPPAPPVPDDRLTSLSVSALVQLARCPKQFYWTVVRPLPRRPNEAARRGNEIHRWIEMRSMGQQRLDDPEEWPDMTPEERAGEPPVEEVLKRSFESSRFASVRPRYVEQPFAIALPGGYIVRGRIDAVYVHDDGRWEIVDYKTGAEPAEDDDTARLQLAMYALAARRIWGLDPSEIEVTYFYLRSGTMRTTKGTDITLDEASLVARFDSIERREFDPVPGPICHWCDFRRFCPPGRAYAAANPLIRDHAGPSKGGPAPS